MKPSLREKSLGVFATRDAAQQAERQRSGTMSNLDFDWQYGPTERQAVSAKIIPFPMARRIRFLERIAITLHSCRKPDEYLARIEKQQRDAMTRRQLPEEVVELQMAAFHKEINWRLEWVRKHHG
jgi:hypothetical protein